MTKSEELCKISGIKPRAYIKIFTNETKAANFGRKLLDKNKKAFDIDSFADRESFVFEIHWKEYPDLFLPSNYLKLLNFYFNFFQGLEIQYFDNEARECEEQGKSYDSRDCFIDCLIFDLKTKSKDRFYLEIDYQNFVKGLQQTEWEY